MQILIFTICDAMRQNGAKVDLIGCYDVIATLGEPARLPSMIVVLKVQFSLEDEGETFDFGMRVVNADGKLMAQARHVVAAGEVPKDKHSVYLHEWEVTNLIFPVLGEYSVDLLLAGETAAQCPLRIVRDMRAL